MEVITIDNGVRDVMTGLARWYDHSNFLVNLKRNLSGQFPGRMEH